MIATSIISFANQKGGTGKTTTCINMGSVLGANNYKVLIIDFDPQANLSFTMGAQYSNSSIVDILENNSKSNDHIIKCDDFDLIPSNKELADYEVQMASMKDRYNVLKNGLLTINKSSKYDFILIDCPPSLSLLTMNAFVASQKIIVPMQLEVYSLQGLLKIIETIGDLNKSLNAQLQISGVLPVMYDKRRKVTNEILQHIKDNISVRVFESYIRTDVRVVEAPSFGMSSMKYAPNSSASTDYKNFTYEFLNNN
ncbi:MAG: ParA family protein [Bacteroidota bacterium]|nr:ParA family protein [Bacteroidota bacterium]